MTPIYYLLLSALLFTVGATGVLVRRTAVNLTLITFSRINGTLDGQIMTIFKTRRSASVDDANLLKY